MPRTFADECKLGLAYIEDLSFSHECKSFSVTKCKCICKCKGVLPHVNFFVNEVNEFWENPDHVSAKKDAAVIGKLFGKFLYSHSFFEFERDGHIFSLKTRT